METADKLCNKIDELMEMISQKMKENKEFTMTISQERLNSNNWRTTNGEKRALN